MGISDLYTEEIIQIAGRLAPASRLAQPDASARRTSRICGSVIEVDLMVRDGRVLAFGQDVNACALGQTSASIVAQHIVGAGVSELYDLRDQVEAMLKEGGAPPGGKWAEIGYLAPVRDFAPRHASVMLVFEAVVACLEKIENPAAN
jgi:NifU-like protein involved in Fe-S cluster formation